MTGDSAINNATVDGKGGPVESGTPGAMIVENTRTLTLDGTTLEDLNVTNNGTLLVESDGTLTLSGVTITAARSPTTAQSRLPAPSLSTPML